MINKKKLFTDLYYIRSVEKKIEEKYHEGKMRCPTHLSIGQEGISAVFANLVKKKDYVISMHRPHAHYLAKGGNLTKMICELYGKDNGCSKGRGGSMHLIDNKVNFMGSTSILGNNLPVGVGLALSSKLKKKENITFIFLGDAAVEQGSFYESINFAAVNSLNILFICENNEFSVYSDLKSRQPKNRKIYELVKKIGVKSVFSNGKKIDDIERKMQLSINYIKKNKKPSFIEIKTSRWLEHCGPNDDSGLGYRSISKLNEWKKNDFLKILEKKISKKNNDVKKIKNNISLRIKNAFAIAESSKFPKFNDLKKGIYEK